MPQNERFAQVIVDISSLELDRFFSYRIPEGLALEPGARVAVPFGSLTKEGYVLGITDSCELEPGKIKSILRVLDDYPAILPALMDLAVELSAKAYCPLALALRQMIPAQMRGGRIKIKTEMAVRILLKGEKLDEARARQARAKKRVLLIDLLSDGEARALEDLKALVKDPLPALKELESQGIVSLFQREMFRSPFEQAAQAQPDFELTASQEEVLSEMIPAVQKGKGEFLLHGVTGSGKTEVYIQAVRACLKLGKTSIILVPEIVLTPQTVAWFRGHFGETAAVLHSKLSSGERYDEWRRIRIGQAKLVIGARSAVFAPVEHLGLIVVDEEHEPSYLSERNPRYDAREIALSRVRREGGVLLLASATPSLLSFAKALRGKYTLLEMPDRANGSPLPHVDIVDMREELRLGNKGIFSLLLQDKLKKCLAEGKQAMLFINRRGYAPGVICYQCGKPVLCDQCDIKMTYHAPDASLHCHYCGARKPMPNTCPHCGSRLLKTVGVGTQRVEEELHKLFPGVETVRLDTDTTGGKDGHRDLLNRFRSGEARVMVGTQMIAKGLDFPQVTLVGAVLADLTLNLPDYRAEERSFQLLTQVAGRAGRGQSKGEVVIQSYSPEHFAIMSAASQDYRAFFKQEFERRRSRLYPPFTMMLRLLCEADKAETAREVSKTLLHQVETLKKKRSCVIFAREDDAPIKRLMGRYRAQVLMKCLNNAEAQMFLEELKALSENEWPCPVLLEVDPASLA